MNLNEEIQKATDSFLEKNLPTMIEAKVSTMVDNLLTDIFQKWSGVSKGIKEKIEQKLDINLIKFDMVDYNHIVSKAINDRLISLVNENAVAPIMDMVQNAVGFVEKKTIKISEIHQMIIDASMEENDQEGDGGISFYVSNNEKYDWTVISFDLESDKDQSRCDFELTVSNKPDRQTIFHVKWLDGGIKGKSLSPMSMAAMRGVEHKIFRLYSAQVKIEMDTDYFDNEWSRYN
jgi:hypothetical protein